MRSREELQDDKDREDYRRECQRLWGTNTYQEYYTKEIDRIYGDLKNTKDISVLERIYKFFQ